MWIAPEVKDPVLTHARQTHDDRTGQRPVPPRQASGSVTEQVCPRAHAFIPAAVQPAMGTDRARPETHAPPGYPQPILRNARRRAGLCAAMLREMAKTERDAETVMRLYFSRYV